MKNTQRSCRDFFYEFRFQIKSIIKVVRNKSRISKTLKQCSISCRQFSETQTIWKVTVGSFVLINFLILARIIFPNLK